MRWSLLIAAALVAAAVGACDGGDDEVDACVEVFDCVTEAGCVRDRPLEARLERCQQRQGLDCEDLESQVAANKEDADACSLTCLEPFLSDDGALEGAVGREASAAATLASTCLSYEMWPDLWTVSPGMPLDEICADGVQWLHDQGECS